MADDQMTTDIALPFDFGAPVNALTNQEAGDRIVEEIERAVFAERIDVSTKNGRASIKSLAYKVARSKTAIDAAGKKLAEEARARVKSIDDARRSMRERLDAIRDRVRKPLDEWEAVEDQRVEGHKRRLAELLALGESLMTSSQDILDRQNRMSDFEPGKALWEEFSSDALIAFGSVRDRLQAALPEARKREAEQAELERLRSEAAERERAEAARRANAREAERIREIEEEAKLRAEREAAEKLVAERRAAAAEAQVQKGEGAVLVPVEHIRGVIEDIEKGSLDSAVMTLQRYLPDG